MSRRMGWEGQGGDYIRFWWESQKERPLGAPTHRWKDNIEIDLRETGWDGMNWIHLAKNRESGLL
jgi:hypothetical protein